MHGSISIPQKKVNYHRYISEHAFSCLHFLPGNQPIVGAHNAASTKQSEKATVLSCRDCYLQKQVQQDSNIILIYNRRKIYGVINDTPSPINTPRTSNRFLDVLWLLLLTLTILSSRGSQHGDAITHGYFTLIFDRMFCTYKIHTTTYDVPTSGYEKRRSPWRMRFLLFHYTPCIYDDVIMSTLNITKSLLLHISPTVCSATKRLMYMG